MTKRIFIAFGVLALFASLSLAQAKKAKPAAPAPQPATISDLVLQGKTADAVKQALRSAPELDSAWMGMLTSIDTQIVLRNLEGAQRNLDAIKTFADACVKSKKIKNIPMDAITGRQFRLKGIQLSDQKEYAKATDLLKQALDLSQKAKDRALEAGVHNNLGFALDKQTQKKEAEKEYDLARRIAEDMKDNLRAGSSNYNLGTVLFDEQEFEAALAAFKRSAEQNKAAAVPHLEARAIMMQGRVSSKMGFKSEAAFQLLQDAETRFEKLGDDLNAGWCYFFMAEYAGFGGDFKRTVELGEKAIPLFSKLSSKESLRQCYDFLGIIYSTMNEPAEKEKGAMYTKLAKELAIEPAKPPVKEPPVKK